MLLSLISITRIRIQIYDHLCTLDLEVGRIPFIFVSRSAEPAWILQAAHVWSHPLSGGSILFFLNRYLPYVDTFMSVNCEHCFISFRRIRSFVPISVNIFTVHDPQVSGLMVLD
jgi:hypothetical protein